MLFIRYSVVMQKTINPAAIKALAIDLDGTLLLPDASLGERTTLCLKALVAGGMQLIVCTVRAVESALPYCNAIDATGPMVFFNGAEVVDIPSLSLVSSHLLKREVVVYGLDVARNMDVHYQVFLPPLDRPEQGRLLVDRRGEVPGIYQQKTGMQPQPVDLKEALAAATDLTGCPKAMFISDKPGVLDAIRQNMFDRFGDSIYLTRTSPIFLEVMNAGVNKGEGLKTAMARRGITPHELIVFGDEENDLPMFPVAGFSAAPSSARENVRQAADFVFGSNAEEGLAAFLQNIFG